MKRIPRRIFTAEFKREAIQLVTQQCLTMAEASRKLDIATKSSAPGLSNMSAVNSRPALAHPSSHQINSVYASWNGNWPSPRWGAIS